MDGKGGSNKTFKAVTPHGKPQLSLFVVELTEQCNFRCKYCCFSGEYHERREHSEKYMNSTTAERVVEFINANYYPGRPVRVTFYGGESLLAFGVMKSMAEKLTAVHGDNITFGISTNGYLLTADVVDWICDQSHCDVFVSLDGDRETHNRNRITRTGIATYDRILGNLRNFHKRYPQDYLKRVEFLVTLSEYTDLVRVSDYWKGDDFLRLKQPSHVSFLLPRDKEEMELSDKKYASFKTLLATAFQRYCAGEESLLVNKFTEWTGQIDASATDEITVTTCVEKLYRTFITVSGDLYLCERFNRDFQIGSIYDTLMFDPTKAEELESHFISRRNKRCSNCHVAEWCSMCMTSLNYSDEEMDILCSKERKIIELIKDFSWKRRRFNREKELRLNNFYQ